jgi:hypothetical protein
MSCFLDPTRMLPRTFPDVKIFTQDMTGTDADDRTNDPSVEEQYAEWKAKEAPCVLSANMAVCRLLNDWLHRELVILYLPASELIHEPTPVESGGTTEPGGPSPPSEGGGQAALGVAHS